MTPTIETPLYTLYRGEALQTLAQLPDKCADAIITDLPYGTTACSWDVVIPFAPMWEQVKRICKGAFVTTASQPFTSLLVASNLRGFRYEWIWEKNKATGHAMSKNRPMKSHENILVFGNGVYLPVMDAGEPYKQPRTNPKYDLKINPAFRVGTNVKDNTEGGRFPRSIINIKNAYYTDGEQEHPTQKPVALYEYLIRTYTNPGDTVMDFCFGSGTTGVACIRTGRKFIGIEQDKNYFQVAVKRIAEAALQPPLLTPAAEQWAQGEIGY